MNSRKLYGVLNRVVRLEAFVVAEVRFPQKRVFWFSMLELFLAIILPVILNIIVALNPRLFEDLPASNLTLTDCYYFSVMFIMQLQFINLVLKLYESYSSINFVLEMLRRRGGQPYIPILDTEQMQAARGKHPLHDPAGTVRQLRKLHCTLCDLLETLNSTYSIQILVCATQHFIGITFNIYSIVVHTIGDQENVAANLAWNVTTSFWLVCDSLIILGVASSCCITAQQANSTSSIVHKLLNEECEVRTKEELQLFSMQLLHRRIQFTACGFFDLDYTFIHSSSN
ncbi:putative gustatory receptor 28b isoform X2 [Bacillus rossius redtenbacheri]|uniref:putative gustatory receptor 28b isoform X2 n=1 Tax=Bacillus rossius redtenbacheri TaxID=93214 RepID=UPI002FDE9214